ncbi:MAG: DMT family transporter [Pseudomonadota bacterium]
MMLSSLGFALMSACVKLVSVYGIPVLEIVAARALVSVCISVADIKRKGISMWGNDRVFLVLRGVIGAFALMCVYYSMTTLPLAEATILQYLHPVFTALFALVLLKEVIQRPTLVCIALSLLGLVVMLLPNLTMASNDRIEWFSVGAALLGAVGSAAAYTVVKRLSCTEDTSVIIFYFPLIALPISLLLLGDDFVMPTGFAWVLLLFVGVFTQVGQIGLTKAMQCESANKATAYSYVQIVFAIVIGWMVFDEVPSLYSMVGGALIVLGALVNVFGTRGYAAMQSFMSNRRAR